MAKKKDNKNLNPTIINRRARFEFEFVTTFEAGIVLTGTEVKAIREGKVNLTDAFCYMRNGELWLKNLHISVYDNGTYNNHDPRSLRKLLLHKKELNKIDSKLKEKGLTVIPYKVYFSDRGFAKIEIALATGKKTFDKRETIKARDSKRDLDRARRSM